MLAYEGATVPHFPRIPDLLFCRGETANVAMAATEADRDLPQSAAAVDRPARSVSLGLLDPTRVGLASAAAATVG